MMDLGLRGERLPGLLGCAKRTLRDGHRASEVGQYRPVAQVANSMLKCKFLTDKIV